MEKTRIEWADSTWNPVVGCLHGCEYCYARRTANRFKGCDMQPTGEVSKNVKAIELTERLKATVKDGKAINAAYPFGFTPTFHRYRLDDLKSKGFGKNIFVCSMADLFGKWVPDEWIVDVFNACKEADGHRYLFLTKNPERYLKLEQAGKLPEGENFWYGSTATDPHMETFHSDKHHTFVSIEPILEKFGNPDDIDATITADWAILGAETGNRRDKVVPKREWVQELVNAFHKAGRPVFMKDSLVPIIGEDGMVREFPW